MFVSGPRILVLIRGGFKFGALLFAPFAVLTEIQGTILHCLLPPHFPIRGFTQCHSKLSLLYIQNKV